MGRNRLTTEKFIEKAKKVHGKRYDYSAVDYVDMHTKVRIKCLEHGIFEILPYAHTNLKTGCYECGLIKAAKSRNKGFEKFKEKANKIHKNTYNYIKSSYIDTQHKLTIVCKLHGKFKQTASDHLNGSGCKKCAFNQK